MVYVNNYNIIEIVITVKIVDQSIANADYLITFISLGQNIPISLFVHQVIQYHWILDGLSYGKYDIVVL